MTFRFFISYAEDDGEIFAQRIEKYLSKRGYEAFTARKILLGEKWREVIDNKIGRCDFFILVLTPSALESSEVSKEVNLANERNKRKIIVKHDYVEQDWNELPLELGDYQAAKFSNKDEMILELNKGIKLLTKQMRPASNQINKLFFEGKDFEIPVKISNGTIISVTLDPDYTSIVITTETSPSKDGILEIELPRTLIDAQGRGDERFYVLENGEEIDFSEIDNTATTRKLSIPVRAGTEEIEIIGTHVAGRTNIVLPEIILDKDEYSVDDSIMVAIVSPMDNRDPDAIDEIKVSVKHLRNDGSISSINEMFFAETGKNTGIFEKHIKLTSNYKKRDCDILVHSGDAIEIEFLFIRNLKASKIVKIK